MARDRERIAMLTCYDASFAALIGRAGVDALLVGDSLGMVIGGHATTLPVTTDHMVHTRWVVAGAKAALVVADMPFGSYQERTQQAYTNAAHLMAAGAQMVRVEGGAWLVPTVESCRHHGPRNSKARFGPSFSTESAP
jgi:3-methyl-2-oxobutanoate hydroxymethyltransferase